MVKYLRHNLALKLDLIGFSASTICAIHCALMPFIILLLPVIGLQFMANPVIEYSFILLSIIIGGFTFRHGYFNHHKKIYPLAIFISGLAIVLAGHFFFHDHIHEDLTFFESHRSDETILFMIVPFGAFLVAVAHFLNRKLSTRKSSSCECG